MHRTFRLVLGLMVFAAAPAMAGDWPQWAGSNQRNFVSSEKGLPDGFDPDPAKDKSASEPISGEYVKWVAKLGVRTHGSPTVSQGRVLIGTNTHTIRDGSTTTRPNDAGGRYACFDEQSGQLVWELTNPRLPEARAPHSDNGYGVCSSGAIEGRRVYLVNDRTDVLCLDLDGLANGNDGPFTDESHYLLGIGDGKTPPPGIELKPTDADIIWRYNIFEQLDGHPHDATSCSPMIVGDLLYVCTGNGINGAENKVLNPLAPSVIVLEKKTGRVVAKDDEKIGTRILKGQWSSLSTCEVGGKMLIIYGGGDGRCYAFESVTPAADGQVVTLKKVWSVECNPADCRVRNGKPVAYRAENGPSEIVGTPVCYHDRIYVCVGRDPERGEGKGRLTCIDPAKGEAVWTYDKIGRSMSTVAIADGLIYVAETFGTIHCIDEKTGTVQWTHEISGRIWNSCLVADGKVYVATSKGLLVFAAGKEEKLLRNIKIGSGCYCTPCAANGVLFVASQKYLYALSMKGGKK